MWQESIIAIADAITENIKKIGRLLKERSG